MSTDCSQGLSVSNAAHTERICLSYSLYLLDLQLVFLCLLLYLANPVAITAVLIRSMLVTAILACYQAEGNEIYRLRLQALNPEFCYQIAAASAC